MDGPSRPSGTRAHSRAGLIKWATRGPDSVVHTRAAIVNVSTTSKPKRLNRAEISAYVHIVLDESSALHYVMEQLIFHTGFHGGEGVIGSDPNPESRSGDREMR